MLFIDNGGDTLRAAYCSHPTNTPKRPLGASTSTAADKVVTVTAPNVVGITSDGTHVYGKGLAALPHYHQLVLRRPTEKGFIVDPQLQALLWSHCLFEPLGIVSEQQIELVLTCPMGCPQDAATVMETLLFDIFKFKSVTVVTPAMLAMVGKEIQGMNAASSCVAEGEQMNGTASSGSKRARKSADATPPPSLSGIVVDCGFSGTTITPFMGGRPVLWNTIRIDVGGKVLTNYLKELISFSQVNVTEDTWLCNVIKEACCFCHHHGGGVGGDVGSVGTAAGSEGKNGSKTGGAVGGQPALEGGISGNAVAAHTARTHSLPSALEIYARWGELPPLGKRKAIAGQKKLLKALKSVKDSKEAAKMRATIPFWFPPPVMSYVLPSTPQTQPLGHVLAPNTTPQDDWQLIRLGHECFIVGEGLMHPSMIGLGQVGIAEALKHSMWFDPRRAGTPLFGAPKALRQSLLSNIVLVGGTGARMSGVADRLRAEIGPVLMSNDDCNGENANNRGGGKGCVAVCSDTFSLLSHSGSTVKGSKGRKVEGADGAVGSAPPQVVPSFVLTGALTLFFGHNSSALATIKAHIGIGSGAGSSSVVGHGFLDNRAFVDRAKMSRDAVREALALIK